MKTTPLTDPDLDRRRAELSRQAAAEGIGEGHGYGRLHPPRHPSRLLGYTETSTAYKVFVEKARAGCDDDTIVEAATKNPGRADTDVLAKEVRRWITLMHEAEQSSTQIAVGPAGKSIQGYAARGADLARLYTVHQDDEKTVLLVPRHVLSWARALQVPFKAVDRYKTKDNETVLEVFCGIYHPTGEKNEAIKALNAARGLVHGEK